MLRRVETIKLPSGEIIIRRHVNFDREFQENHELKKEKGKGFSKSRELRHIARIPLELEEIDPLVAAALRGDRVCMRLAMARYPGIKICEGGV
jgi:transposase